MRPLFGLRLLYLIFDTFVLDSIKKAVYELKKFSTFKVEARSKITRPLDF